MGRVITAIFVGILLVAAALIFLRGDAPDESTVLLYYYNPANDMDIGGNIMCGRNGLVPVERSIQSSDTILEIRDAIRLLIAGNLSEAEKKAGVTTEFPLEGFQLTDASLEGGVLTLTFVDPLNKASGGSCRVGVLSSQVEATAKQFEGVQTVRIMPEEIFQP